MIRNKVVSVVSAPPSAAQLDPMRHLGISLALALAFTCSDSIAASANESVAALSHSAQLQVGYAGNDPARDR
jgi:hypothetical protein